MSETTQNPFPYYERAPVTETVLGVQFNRLPRFHNAHLGAFWQTLDTNEWRKVLDVPALPPQFERFENAARWAKGIQLQVTQDPASRMQIKNENGDRMIQLQNDRLLVNWLGDTGFEYPRYENVREWFVSALHDFVNFVEQQEVGDFHPNQWEVTYVNQIPKGSVWSTPDEWSFFKPLCGVPTIENLLQGESFSGEWHFVIPNQKGRLHVKLHHGLKPTSDESENEIVQVMFTARGPIEKVERDKNQLQAILDGLDLGRKTIVLSFKELMSDKANKHWGLSDVND